ncbi:MAG: amidohydrolase [Mogibacterium sp.]|nr:amidohydrolase [Mogibacterium sp.]
MSELLQKANEILEEIIAIRRDIHAHPEMGRKEIRTSALIREKLEEYGVDEIESPTPTSVVGVIKGRKGAGKCIAIRTDIDALPVQEETGLPFASQTPNVMHACGHDIHCAMMLGNAKILCGMRDQFAGSVKLIFQHSEDTFPGGAKELVGLGVMDGVDAVLGMHVFPTVNEKCGVIGLREGPFTTSTDDYWFEIIGTGGHGSLPHKAPDPILAAAEMIMMFQQVQARAVAPLDAAIFMMNKIEGGKAPNIIADKLIMAGNARSYTAEARAVIKDYAYRIAEGVEKISGCKINVNPAWGYDSCYNDPALTNTLLPILEESVGADRVELFDDPMGFSEDFSFYSTLTGVPAVFMILQAGTLGDPDNIPSLHNARCTFNEEAIPYGMAAMIGCALGFLRQ